MNKQIMKDFRDGNVCITGLRGRGKDMLMANVVYRRGIPYVSNVAYDDNAIKFDPKMLAIGYTYKDFIEGNYDKEYEYPYADGTDIYISDSGVYFPSQYNNELDKHYRDIPTFMALSRQLGQCNVHCNSQSISRIWLKIKEQSDIFYQCEWCKVFPGGIVLQSVIRYDMLSACEQRLKPFKDYYPRRPLLNRERQQKWDIEKAKYELANGHIKRYILLYLNMSNYDTRIFKTILKGGGNNEKKDK